MYNAQSTKMKMRAAVILSKIRNFSKIVPPHLTVYNLLAIKTQVEISFKYKTYTETYRSSRKLNVYLYTAFLGEKGP